MTPKLLNHNICSGSVCLFTSILQPCFSVSTNSILWRKLYQVNIEFSVTKSWQRHIRFAHAFMNVQFVLYVKRMLNCKLEFFSLLFGCTEPWSGLWACWGLVRISEELRRLWQKVEGRLTDEGAGVVARSLPEGSRRQGALRARLVSGPRPKGL